MTARFLETADIVAAFVPVDMQTAANDGDWVNLQNFERCVAVLFKAIGTAGDDPVFTVKQATDNAGSNAKALNISTIWSKVGTLSGISGFTKNTQAAGATYTDAASAEAQAIMAVDILAEELDSEGGFTHIQLSIPDVGGNAQLGCGFYILLEPRTAGATVPSAIA